MTVNQATGNMRNAWDPIGSAVLVQRAEAGSGRLPRQTGKMAPGNQAPAGRRPSARKHVNRCIRGGNSGSTNTARQRAQHLQARWVPHWTLGANATSLAVASVCSRRGRRSVQHLAQRGYSHPRCRARRNRPGGADTASQPDLGNPAGGTQIAGGVGQLRRVRVLSYGDPPSETFSGRQRNSRLERCIGAGVRLSSAGFRGFRSVGDRPMSLLVHACFGEVHRGIESLEVVEPLRIALALPLATGRHGRRAPVSLA